MINIESEKEVKDSERYLLSSIIYYLNEVEEIIDISLIDVDYFITSQARRIWQSLNNVTPINGKYDPVQLIGALRKFCFNNQEVENCIRYLNELTTEIHYFSVDKYIKVFDE